MSQSFWSGFLAIVCHPQKLCAKGTTTLYNFCSHSHNLISVVASCFPDRMFLNGWLGRLPVRLHAYCYFCYTFPLLAIQLNSSVCMTLLTLSQWITVYCCPRPLVSDVACVVPLTCNFFLCCVSFFHLQSDKMLWLHPASLRFFLFCSFTYQMLRFFTCSPSLFKLSPIIFFVNICVWG